MRSKIIPLIVFIYQLTSYKVQKRQENLNEINIWYDHALPLKQHRRSSAHLHTVFHGTGQVGWRTSFSCSVDSGVSAASVSSCNFRLTP